MPIPKQADPAKIVFIDARMFEVTEFYLDKIVENFKKQKGIELT